MVSPLAWAIRKIALDSALRARGHRAASVQFRVYRLQNSDCTCQNADVKCSEAQFRLQMQNADGKRCLGATQKSSTQISECKIQAPPATAHPCPRECKIQNSILSLAFPNQNSGRLPQNEISDFKIQGASRSRSIFQNST